MASTVAKQMSGFNDIALLIGRILVAALFVIAGYNAFKSLGGSIGYFGRLGIPMPDIMAPFVAGFEIVVGLIFLVGYQTRLAALALGILVIFAALIAHTNFADMNQVNHFLKCVAIIGGCLAFFVTGAGAYSLDAKQGRA